MRSALTDRIARVRRAATAPVDTGSLVALRVLFGLLGLVSSTRFLANGWVDDLYGEPTFFFRYWGFEWVPVPSVPVVYALYVVMALSAVGVALGWRTRASALVHLIAFTWVELIDVTNYLNHYYLMTLVGLLFVCLPLGRAGSLDARRRPDLAVSAFPAWMAWLVRFQIGVVYVFAGLAKAGPDWLGDAQPLNLWLTARQDFPLLGGLFDEPAMALALSWAGFLHDLAAPFLLQWRRTRAWAYAALVAFHLTTHLLFDIGMFPFIMTALATVFFAPDWPRRVARRLASALSRSPRPATADRDAMRPWSPPASRWARGALGAAVVVWAAWQVLVPLRTHLYGGDVLWHEQGMRWSWRVMVREKNGSVEYRVRVADRAGEIHVSPRRYLTAHQEREMGGQPDLILQLAHHIADDYRARGHRGIEVRVDAFASLNGRRPARLIDGEIDLTSVADGLGRASWILPAPASRPPRLVPVRIPVAKGPP